MKPEEYPEWQEAVPVLAGARGTVLLLGATDVGKTTLRTLVARAAWQAGRRVAVVDADVGQSEIGPPGCVGMLLLDSPERLRDATRADALAFVGAPSPSGRMLEHAAATLLMAEAATEAGADLVLVDTTGLVEGAPARRLKWAKLRLLRPRVVVALQRSGELEPILRLAGESPRSEVLRLPVPAVIRPKPASFRAQRRKAAYARWFADAVLRTYLFERVSLLGPWLGTGTPLAPHLLRFLSRALGVRAYYAEMDGRRLGIVTDGMPTAERSLEMIHAQFRPRSITITPASRFHHLLVGLADREGRILDVGTVETLDFRRREIGVLTPTRAHAAVRHIEFGAVRVRPDGVELGILRPGDI